MLKILWTKSTRTGEMNPHEYRNQPPIHWCEADLVHQYPLPISPPEFRTFCYLVANENNVSSRLSASNGLGHFGTHRVWGPFFQPLLSMEGLETAARPPIFRQRDRTAKLDDLKGFDNALHASLRRVRGPGSRAAGGRRFPFFFFFPFFFSRFFRGGW